MSGLPGTRSILKKELQKVRASFACPDLLLVLTLIRLCETGGQSLEHTKGLFQVVPRRRKTPGFFLFSIRLVLRGCLKQYFVLLCWYPIDAVATDCWLGAG